jgi:energy-coupling factor transporter ATP-binding protein EcfA2/uncharacterized membrane protein
MECVEIRALSFSYPGGERPALSDVSLGVERGQLAALCGPSGGGKTTLLRLLKPAAAPVGEMGGDIVFDGAPLSGLPARRQASAIGYVGQSPENQIVTDKVWHELAFGLESLGLENGEIRRRTAEMAAFFGISDWFYRDAASLSGGQKQILNLASVMVMQPELLLLDEPTSRLDPVAAADFLAAVGRINRELGTTVIIAEHHLGEVLPMAGAVHVLDGGQLIFSGTPGETGEYLRRHRPGIFLSMPEPMRIWSAVLNTLPCPITPQEGAGWLARYAASRPLLPVPPEKTADFSGEPAAELKNIWFRYEKEAPDVLKGLNLKAYPGEILAVLGGNGAGKSTLLSVAAGAEKPLRGRVAMRGRTAMLPQEPLTLFAKDTVRAELERAAGTKENFEKTVELCALSGLLNRHPADLSGGELQRAALARVLLAGADILLLDEPTKGVDAQFKRSFGKILRGIAAGGAAIIMASHDTEFCAAFAHRCALLFDGELTAEATPRKFFSANFFYTTPASRMARALLPEAVTPEDVVSACGGEPPDDDGPGGELYPPRKAETPDTDVCREPGGARAAGQRRRLPAGTARLIALCLALIPVTVLAGAYYFGERKYYFISMLVLLETAVPFLLAFEGGRPQTRRLAVTAVLCALAVAGRAAFFMLPSFKPVLAIVIISGAAYGGETGFLVGAVSMLASNILFGQGPWTPWQMLGMGLSGFLAGVIFSGRLRPEKAALCVFGALAALLVYGPTVNFASALIWQPNLNWGMVLAALASGLPFDLIHAGATVVFLWLGAEPMLKKLERMETKYGVMSQTAGKLC